MSSNGIGTRGNTAKTTFTADTAHNAYWVFNKI